MPEANNHPARSASKVRLSIGATLTVLALLLAIALGAGFALVQHIRARRQEELESQAVADENATPVVDVTQAKYAPRDEPLVLPGETRGWYQSTIYARVSGYVGKWFNDIGDQVHKGQVLATIETPDLDQQLIAAQQKLAVSQSQVKVEEANSNFAKETYERWRDSPPGVVSEQEREEKQAEFTSSVARLNAANAQVNADKADVDQLEALEDFKNVTAPFDGIITERKIDIGDLVTAGSTSNTTLLYSIAQTTRVRVFVDVPQRVAGSLDMTTSAAIVSNEFPGRKFEGKIARTSKAIDPQARTLRVEVDVPNQELTLQPGMYVEATLQLSHGQNLQVPASAMLFRSSGPQIAVVDGDGKVEFRNVQIAVDQGDFVELASGVSPGERVALNLSSSISDGEHVTAHDDDEQHQPGMAVGAK